MGMSYIPASVILRRGLGDASAFSLTIEGSFYDYVYIRRRLLGVEVTRMEGSGELSSFLPELLWRFRVVGEILIARLDAPGEQGEEGKPVRLLRARNEEVRLHHPALAKGWYELQTTVRSIETIHDLLTEASLATEYLEFYYFAPTELGASLPPIPKAGRAAVKPDHVVPAAELLVTDESDKEGNLFGIYGPSRNEDRVVGLIRETCEHFGIALTEELAK